MYLKLTVQPGAGKEVVEKIDEENYKIWIRQEAENGQANKRVVKILSEMFPNKQIRIVTGMRSFKKLVKIG